MTRFSDAVVDRNQVPRQRRSTPSDLFRSAGTFHRHRKKCSEIIVMSPTNDIRPSCTRHPRLGRGRCGRKTIASLRTRRQLSQFIGMLAGAQNGLHPVLCAELRVAELRCMTTVGTDPSMMREISLADSLRAEWERYSRSLARSGASRATSSDLMNGSRDHLRPQKQASKRIRRQRKDPAKNYGNDFILW